MAPRLGIVTTLCTCALGALVASPLLADDPVPVAPAPEVSGHAPAAPEAVDRALGARFGRGRFTFGDTPHRLILFTFDDGPFLPLTPRLLDTLDALELKAVFFVVGHRIVGDGPVHTAQRELLHDMVRRGHMIANHTMTHDALNGRPDEEIVLELRSAEQAIEQALGARPWLFRSPGGGRTPRIRRVAAELGYTMVLWNQGGDDYLLSSTEEVVRSILRKLDYQERTGRARGGIVVLHDTFRFSVDAVPVIFDELMRRNCRLLEQPGEELYDFVDDFAPFFQPLAEAAPGTGAGPAVLPPEVLAARQARARERSERWCAERDGTP